MGVAEGVSHFNNADDCQKSSSVSKLRDEEALLGRPDQHTSGDICGHPWFRKIRLKPRQTHERIGS